MIASLRLSWSGSGQGLNGNLLSSMWEERLDFSPFLFAPSCLGGIFKLYVVDFLPIAESGQILRVRSYLPIFVTYSHCTNLTVNEAQWGGLNLQ